MRQNKFRTRGIQLVKNVRNLSTRLERPLPNAMPLEYLVLRLPEISNYQTQRVIWQEQYLDDAWRRYYKVYTEMLESDELSAKQMREKDLVGLAACSSYAETLHLMSLLPPKLRIAIQQHKYFDIFSVEEFFFHCNQEIEVRGNRQGNLDLEPVTIASMADNDGYIIEEVNTRKLNDNNSSSNKNSMNDDHNDVDKESSNSNWYSQQETRNDYQASNGGQTEWVVRLSPPSLEDLRHICEKIEPFANDGRGNIKQTLHRASIWRTRNYENNNYGTKYNNYCTNNYKGKKDNKNYGNNNYDCNEDYDSSGIKKDNYDIAGITIRVGRYVPNVARALLPLVERGNVLILSIPGLGKTTLLRDLATTIANCLANMPQRVIVVDTSNEIAGDDDAPLPFMGRCRRMQVPYRERQEETMIEVIQNHTPEVIVIDELSTEKEAEAAESTAQRGVRLIATCHGNSLAALVQNKKLNTLVGGAVQAFLSSEERRMRNKQKKTILERPYSSPFQYVVELRSRREAYVYVNVNKAVDVYLDGRNAYVEDKVGCLIKDISQPAPCELLKLLNEKDYNDINNTYINKKWKYDLESLEENNKSEFEVKSVLTSKQLISSLTSPSFYLEECLAKRNNKNINSDNSNKIFSSINTFNNINNRNNNKNNNNSSISSSSSSRNTNSDSIKENNKNNIGLVCTSSSTESDNTINNTFDQNSCISDDNVVINNGGGDDSNVSINGVNVVIERGNVVEAKIEMKTLGDNINNKSINSKKSDCRTNGIVHNRSSNSIGNNKTQRNNSRNDHELFDELNSFFETNIEEEEEKESMKKTSTQKKPHQR